MNELKIMPENIVNDLVKDNLFKNIVTRANAADFYTFNQSSLVKISEAMPEINRATRTLGRSNTQTTNKLMTLTMLNGNTSPYRLLRQCLTQIEDRRTALKENIKTLTEAKIEVEKLEEEIKIDHEELNYLNSIENINFETRRNILNLSSGINSKINTLEHKKASIADSMCYLEGCLKDIASFQESYAQIKNTNNIPDNWDEQDVENNEIEFHLKQIFLHCYRDFLVHGSIGMGTIEYMNQFGVHPNVGIAETINYLNSIEQDLKNNKFPNSIHLDVWLKEMAEKYKNEYINVLNGLGISEMISQWCLYKDRNKAIEE